MWIHFLDLYDKYHLPWVCILHSFNLSSLCGKVVNFFHLLFKMLKRGCDGGLIGGWGCNGINNLVKIVMWYCCRSVRQSLVITFHYESWSSYALHPPTITLSKDTTLAFSAFCIYTVSNLYKDTKDALCPNACTESHWRRERRRWKKHNARV